MKVGLKFFNLTKQTKKPTAHFINKNTGKELKSLTKYVCKTTGETLYRSQIGTHFPVKDQKVLISEADMKKIKHFEHPGMKLLGFKARSAIKAFHNIRPSYFIYPDEKTMKGSSQTFHAMIKSLVKKDKVAMVRFVAREGAMVRF
jgi:ATP-dependent DNA helicase 2 subunit 1